MIAIEPIPASDTHNKRVELIEAAKAKPARAAEIEANLPPTLWRGYRASWVASLADAKSTLVWIWSCTACRGYTDDGKRSHWIDIQPRSIVDKVVHSFMDVDRICREVRNSADVLNRLEVEATLLKEASFARRESIKLRNELYQEDVVEVLSELLLTSCTDKDDDGALKGLRDVFSRMTTSLTSQSGCLPHNAKTVALEEKIFQKLCRDLDRAAWPHIVLPKDMAGGLGKKALRTTYRDELQAYDVQLRHINFKWILSRAVIDGVRETAYHDHIPVILEIGYKRSNAWLNLRRQVSASRNSESIATDLVKGTPFTSIDKLLKICNDLRHETRPLLQEETSIIRRSSLDVEQKGSEITCLFEAWQEAYRLREYKKLVMSQMQTENPIRCFERIRILSTLRDLANGLLGCQFVIDPAFPGRQDGSDSFEVWRIYDTLTGSRPQTEIGRIFLDCSTKRKSASAKENPCRSIEVMQTAPLGSQPVPQALWSLTFPSRSALLSLDGVITLAQEFGDILDTIFRLLGDPHATVQPRSASEADKSDHAPLRITAEIIKLMVRQPRTLEKMLHPDAVQYDFVQRLIKTKYMAQIHETRSQLAKLHAWASVIKAANKTSKSSTDSFQKIYSFNIDIWGSCVAYESRFPPRLFVANEPYLKLGITSDDHRPWLGPWIELRRGLKDVAAVLIAAQVVERLIPCGIDKQDMIFDQEIVKVYRSYLQRPGNLTDPEARFVKLFDSLGEEMRVKPFVNTLAQDLAAFKEENKVEQAEEDPRFKALRPLIIRLVQRRVAMTQAKAVKHDGSKS